MKLVMPDMTEGQEGRYFWLQRPMDNTNVNLPLSVLIGDCAGVLLNNYVVVTSIDSGPLQLSDKQIGAGWQRDRRLALSPAITNADEVPFNWFDEWYIFDKPTVPTDVEVFVNYGTFSLGEPNPTIDSVYIGPDAKVKSQLADAAVLMRQKFWMQLERINPISYVANGNCFNFVTCDAGLYEMVGAALRS